MVMRTGIGVSAAEGVNSGVVGAESDCPIRARYELSSSRYITVKGLRIHYSAEGSGPPLLLLHGVAASLHTWDGWVHALARHYRVIRVDLPGCGFSDALRARDHYTPEYTVDLFEEVRIRLGLERFHLAGNSLGGFFAWYYAAHYPEHVDKLVLLSPIAYQQELPPMLSLLATWGIGEAARFVSPRFVVQHSVRMVYGDPRLVPSSVVDRYHALVSHRRNRHALVETVRRIKLFACDPELALHVRKLRAPTLLMWGGRDRLVPAKLIAAWQRDVDHLELKLYPEAGHIPMEEYPAETARDAHEFLSR